MLVLVAVSLVLLLVAAAFSVDVAYMHLVRKELHIATDAAAKAAVTGLSLGGSAADAKAQAVAYAAKNTVGGAPLTISTNDVKIGGVTYVSNGRWTFTEGATPTTAASVTANMTANSVTGAVKLFFGKVLGRETFSPKMSSTAAFVRNKVCLCFDRSRSMTFDTSGTDEKWPMSASGWPVGVPSTLSTENKQKYPPCNLSRWYYLAAAANIFLDVLEDTTTETPVALVTWGSSTSTSPYYFQKNLTYATRSFPTTTTDSTFVYDYTNVRSAISNRTKYTMFGGTDMNAGLQAAVNLFNSTEDGLPWNKIIILFSDGQWNVGSNPVTNAAVNAAAANIVVHTVGMLNTGVTGTQALQSIATQTGGRYFYAPDGASLQETFEQLAKTLPVILTE